MSEHTAGEQGAERGAKVPCDWCGATGIDMQQGSDVPCWFCRGTGSTTIPRILPAATPDAGDDASEWRCDSCGSDTHDTTACSDTPVPAMLWISHADLAARVSAAATKARADAAAPLTEDEANEVDFEMGEHMYRHSISNNINRMGCDVGCRTDALKRAVDKVLAARIARLAPDTAGGD